MNTVGQGQDTETQEEGCEEGKEASCRSSSGSKVELVTQTGLQKCVQIKYHLNLNVFHLIYCIHLKLCHHQSVVMLNKPFIIIYTFL